MARPWPVRIAICSWVILETRWRGGSRRGACLDGVEVGALEVFRRWSSPSPERWRLRGQWRGWSLCRLSTAWREGGVSPVIRVYLPSFPGPYDDGLNYARGPRWRRLIRPAWFRRRWCGSGRGCGRCGRGRFSSGFAGGFGGCGKFLRRRGAGLAGRRGLEAFA